MIHQIQAPHAETPCGCHDKPAAATGAANEWHWMVIAALAALVLLQAIQAAEMRR